MTALREITRDYQEAGALHSLIGLVGFIDKNVFLTKGGDVGVVLSVKGKDAECLDHAERDQIARRFESAVRTFDERFRLYQYMFKRDHATIPHEHYDNPVVERAIKARSEFLEAKGEALFAIDVFFVVVYENPSRLGRPSFVSMLSTRKSASAFDEQLARNCETLLTKTDSFAMQLRDDLRPELLDKSSASRVLRRLVNFAPHKAETPPIRENDLDFLICDSSLECHRDHLQLDDYLVQVLTLKEPPVQTFAGVLNAVADIPANCIVVSEWKRESNLAIRKELNSKRRHFHNSKASMTNYLGDKAANPQEMLIDDGAAGVVADLGGCLRELEINGNYFGQFSLTVVLLDQQRSRLRQAVAECFKVFGTHDAALTEERYNLLNAFLAIVPGNRHYNLRRLWLLNTNYSDMSFLFAQHRGDMHNSHLDSEYLAVLETNTGTPHFFNFHYQDVAHTMILGATGSGKSFLLNFLLTNVQKYDPQTYIFDLGGSYEHLTRLFGGSFLQVGMEHRPFQINPFCLEPTRENLHFLYSFARVLIESSGYRLTSNDERDLYEQIENVYELDQEHRRLFTLANILSRGLAHHLHKWVQGGQYGHLFDNAEDNLTLAQFQTFDFEGMDKYPQVLEPLLFYILHRANASIYDPKIATKFKVFVMDEAWRFLKNHAIKQYVTEAVKTWRKRNAAMVLATQSPDDLEKSEMLSVIVESCATKIFLANPGMDRESYRNIFHLNLTELDLIAKLLPKRQLLIQRPDYSKVANLNIDAISYWLYTSDPFDNQRRREAFEQFGFERGLEALARSKS